MPKVRGMSTDGGAGTGTGSEPMRAPWAPGRRLPLYRTALVLSGVLVPLFGIVFALGTPDAQDPLGQRLVLSALALGLWAASSREAVARHLGSLLAGYLCVLGGWLLFWAADTRFSPEDIGGLLVFQFGLLLLFSTVREVLAHTVAWVGAIAFTLAFVPDPEVAPSFLLGFPLGLAAAGGAAAWERDRLIATIVEQRDTLEDRVKRRTEALRREVSQRREAELRALAAVRTKSTFLMRMSHELRTPINAIVGYTEMVRDEIDDEDQVEDLGQVLLASERLLGLVDDLLDVSRLERGELALLPIQTTLKAVVEAAVGAMQRGIEANGNMLVVHPVPEAELYVDEGRVIQILANLLHNAGRFTHTGTVQVRATVTPAGACVEVEDDGPGIAPEIQERIFESFAQGDESTVRQADGAGLGLAIGRELARRMEGDLTLCRTGAEGTLFRLVLPVDQGVSTSPSSVM